MTRRAGGRLCVHARGRAGAARRRRRSPRHYGLLSSSWQQPPLVHPVACLPAGEVTAKRPLLTEVDPSEIVRVVGTNVTGSLLGCQQAVRLMAAQPAAAGGGPQYHVFVCGFSKWGAKVRLPRWAAGLPQGSRKRPCSRSCCPRTAAAARSTAQSLLRRRRRYHPPRAVHQICCDAQGHKARAEPAGGQPGGRPPRGRPHLGGRAQPVAGCAGGLRGTCAVAGRRRQLAPRRSLLPPGSRGAAAAGSAAAAGRASAPSSARPCCPALRIPTPPAHASRAHPPSQACC